ncbi:unnamed protein product [Debaryomyces tyrocola]|nr:unnamed protein product [Debaryomyces tyrocola]
MLLLFVLLLSGILYNTGIVTDASLNVLDNSMRDVCIPIISEPEASIQAAILIKLRGVVPSRLKVPVLLFRYEDILNFTTLPSREEYEKGYTSNYSSSNLNWDNYFLKNSVDFEENKFILDLYEGYNEIDEKRIYNGFLDRYTEAVLPVYESGMYCVYLAPPIEQNFDVRFYLKVQNSKFYSSDMRYTNYRQTIYIIVAGLLLTVFLINDILKFSTDKRLKIRNVPIISKVVLFYILIPVVLFVSLEWLVVFIELHCNLSNRKIRYFKYFHLAIEWIQTNWNILLQFYILLFTMGYGVIYYHKGASRTFSKMPKRNKNLALSLFITNIILSNTQKQCLACVRYLMSFPTLALYKDMIRFISMVWLYGQLVFPFIWYFVSFIYYLKTRSIIKKLPRTLTRTEEIDAITRIVRAFKQSILVVFISPTISPLARLIAYGPLSIKSSRSAQNDFTLQLSLIDNDLLRESLISLVKSINDKFMRTKLHEMSLDRAWPGALEIYLTIGLLYVIWIRNNNALVVEDEKEDLKE